MSYVTTVTKDVKPDRRLLTGLCGEANIRTPLGGRRVEMLHPGDMVVTRHNGLQPVRMIWTWTVSEEDMRRHSEFARFA